MNQFLNSWYSAVQDSGSIVESNVDYVVQLVDPLQKSEAVFDDLVLALTAITSFAGPLVGAGASISLSAVSTFAQIMQRALKNDGTNLLSNSLYPSSYPTGTTEPQTIQAADLKAKLALVIDTAKTNIAAALNTTMYDMTIFLAFANQNIFSGGPPTTLDVQDIYLWYTFNTYIISRALKGNGINGVVGLNTNPQALATSQTALNYELPACNAYDAQNICDAWWYSGALSSAFGLDNFGAMETPYGGVLDKLIGTYTTGELLFESAYNCSHANQTSTNLAITPGGINDTCISQLQILTWDMSCDDPMNTTCEFLEQGRQNDFLNDGHGSAYDDFDDSDRQYSVPNSYLGPLITQSKYKLRRN